MTKPRLGSSAKILIGLVSGILVGLFLGDYAAVFEVAADVFIKLLQMSVLPYVTVSIVRSLGSLSYEHAKRLGLKAGVVLLGLWVLALGFAFLLPLAFPDTDSASFFSSTLVQQPRPFNFVDLFVPSNPFHSLANAVVPAVVVFSLFFAVALIGVERKQSLLDGLAVVQDALAKVTKFVVGLMPYGIFAIAANDAGTLGLAEVARIQVYLLVYTSLALFLALWVLPGLISALTPFRYREILGRTRDALITAFMAGDLFIVLPILIQACKDLLERHGLVDEESRTLPDVIVPASFNFPHTGKLLSVSFILFAGWYANAEVPAAQYPELGLTGLLTFFGSLSVAVPFLLDLFRIPADTFQLFVATGVINSRFGALLAAVHTLAVALIGSAAIAGTLRFSPLRIARFAGMTVLLTAVVIGGLRALTETVLKPQFSGQQLVYSMRPLMTEGGATWVEAAESGEAVEKPAGSVLAAIHERGMLRVGFRSKQIPFSFVNGAGELVGFDVEMARLLARDLGVGIEFVHVHDRPGALSDLLAAGRIDLAMAGIAVTPERAVAMLFSEPYLDETFAFVVKDHLRSEFSSWESVRKLRGFKLAFFNRPYYVAEIRRRAPNLKLELLDTVEEIKSGLEHGTFDATALPAERGSVLTLLYPKFTVVVPQPGLIKIPLAYPVARHEQEWVAFINTWIELKRRDGTIPVLYDHWILGKRAGNPTPRWSILRNVLGWVR